MKHRLYIYGPRAWEERFRDTEKEHKTIPATETIVSVVIPSLNTSGPLRNALWSWMSQEIVIKFEVIVVDMCSNDGTLKMIEDEFPSVCVVRDAPNGGHGAAVNLGAQRASWEWLHRES